MLAALTDRSRASAAGRPDDRRRTRHRGRSRPTPSTVNFLGPVTHRRSAYATGQVVVISSADASMPYALIESMMCGRPTICIDDGAPRPDGRLGAMIVPPDDPQALAEACVTLLGSPRPPPADVDGGGTAGPQPLRPAHDDRPVPRPLRTRVARHVGADRTARAGAAVAPTRSRPCGHEARGGRSTAPARSSSLLLGRVHREQLAALVSIGGVRPGERRRPELGAPGRAPVADPAQRRVPTPTRARTCTTSTPTARPSRPSPSCTPLGRQTMCHLDVGVSDLTLPDAQPAARPGARCHRRRRADGGSTSAGGATSNRCSPTGSRCATARVSTPSTRTTGTGTPPRRASGSQRLTRSRTTGRSRTWCTRSAWRSPYARRRRSRHRSSRSSTSPSSTTVSAAPSCHDYFVYIDADKAVFDVETESGRRRSARWRAPTASPRSGRHAALDAFVQPCYVDLARPRLALRAGEARPVHERLAPDRGTAPRSTARPPARTRSATGRSSRSRR